MEVTEQRKTTEIDNEPREHEANTTKDIFDLKSKIHDTSGSNAASAASSDTSQQAILLNV